MKKVIVLLNTLSERSDFLLIGDKLTEFLADDKSAVLAVRSSIIDKITVLDVNEEFMSNQAEQLQILRKSRLRPDGIELNPGQMIVTETGLCQFKEYGDNHIVDSEGSLHYKVLRLATDEDLKPKKPLRPTHKVVKKKSLFSRLFGRG